MPPIARCSTRMIVRSIVVSQCILLVSAQGSPLLRISRQCGRAHALAGGANSPYPLPALGFDEVVRGVGTARRDSMVKTRSSFSKFSLTLLMPARHSIPPRRRMLKACIVRRPRTARLAIELVLRLLPSRSRTGSEVVLRTARGCLQRRCRFQHKHNDRSL
ncbi:hypothetical protein C8Q79DRAFT_656669 [Trametes meyenii]|nr:hypothetical protein C8Q79DRAFT_656669 [Trametes meyenii]